MVLPKIPLVTISAVLGILLLPCATYSHYFGAKYVSEKESSRSEYYCLRTDGDRMYQRFGDWVQNAKEKMGNSVLPLDSMIQMISFNPKEKSSLHLNYMFGEENAVGIFEDSIQYHYNNVDSTVIRRISPDSVEMIWLSDATSEYFGNNSRYHMQQTIVWSDSTLPAIHPINIEFPEIHYLPSVIITKNTTWRLEEVFYDKDRIDDLLSILYRDDFHPITETDFNTMLRNSGMNKQEWWAYIQKKAEEMEPKK